MSRPRAAFVFTLAAITVPVIFSVIAVAQPAQDPFSQDPREPREAINGLPDPEGAVPRQAGNSAADAYIDLVKQKIGLLSADDLTREVEALRKELAELHAARKLREAEQLLEQIVKEHPQGPAADRAKMMLEAGRHAEDRLNRSGFLQPQVFSRDNGRPIESEIFETAPRPRSGKEKDSGERR